MLKNIYKPLKLKRNMQKRGKKGAIELSIGTIVIVVLAMSMLILGLVLVRSIFTGAKYNVDQMNDKVKDQIGKLFTEEKRTVIYLGNAKATIKQNEDWGVAFAIKNLGQGTAESSKFSYEIVVSDPDLRKKCGISERDVMSWISTGRADDFTLPPGQLYYGITRFTIPETAPLCTVRFHLEVKKDNANYAIDLFDVQVTS